MRSTQLRSCGQHGGRSSSCAGVAPALRGLGAGTEFDIVTRVRFPRIKTLETSSTLASGEQRIGPFRGRLYGCHQPQPGRCLMTPGTISRLGQRMIEDMNARNLQRGHIR